jgi:hypothetical protein
MGQVPESMLSAICAVSAALSTNGEVLMLGASRIGEVYASSARQACSPILTSDAPATANDLRTVFLLGLYEFRNSPNQRAWETIGHLVRLAYHYGIHQIDNPTNCSFYEPGVTSSTDLESLRYLWWSIYILDTCCNTTAATLSNIDLDSLCTALPAGTIENWTIGEETASAIRHFLGNDIEELSNTLRKISSNWLKNVKKVPDVDVNFAIRIINTSQLREACDLRRAISQNPLGRFNRRWQLLPIHHAATRLALPARYLDPQRKAYLGELKHSHALRLLNLLEITIANLIVSMPKALSEASPDFSWLADWDSSIGIIDEIVQIVKNWDPRMCYLTDPCVGYIIFVAMIMIHIDSKLQYDHRKPAEGDDSSRSSWQLLNLFLQQLSNQWHLPKALIGKVDLLLLSLSLKLCCFAG